jgi:predicted negative regulator of RcsB-dependent stress response
MYPTARIVVFLALVVTAFPIFAQKPNKEDEEKQRRNLVLLEQILLDSRGLRLPENRAYVSARAGSALWKADPKRARQLFESSVTDLIAGQTEAEAERQTNSQNFQALKYGQQPRWTILFMIGGCDAAFALEAMSRSRTPRLERAIADSGMGDSTNARQFANEESQNEQRLIALAADQDPALAIRQVRESLKRGVNYYTLSLLRKIALKNPEAARGLAAEAIKKLLEDDYRVNAQSAEVLSQFFNDAVREANAEEKALRIPDDLVREMADKLLRFWLDKETTSYYGRSASFAAIEKYFPDRAARVKQKFDEMDKRNQGPQNAEYTRLMAAETTVEEMVSGAPKLTGYMRNEVYRRAAERLAEKGGLAQAEKLLTESMPRDDAESYINQMNANQSYRMMGESKFDEALAAIERMTDQDQKINLLISLAGTIYGRDPKENEKMAASVLVRARSLLPDEPETFEDIGALFNLAAAYAPIDPVESFRIAEQLVPLLNEVDGANATITRLRSYGTFRRGEFEISGGQFTAGISGMDNLLRVLRDKDFDRALELANRFGRLETRVMLRMQLIDETSFTSISLLPISGRSLPLRIGDFRQEF